MPPSGRCRYPRRPGAGPAGPRAPVGSRTSRTCRRCSQTSREHRRSGAADDRARAARSPRHARARAGNARSGDAAPAAGYPVMNAEPAAQIERGADISHRPPAHRRRAAGAAATSPAGAHQRDRRCRPDAPSSAGSLPSRHERQRAAGSTPEVAVGQQYPQQGTGPRRGDALEGVPPLMLGSVRRAILGASIRSVIGDRYGPCAQRSLSLRSSRGVALCFDAIGIGEAEVRHSGDVRRSCFRFSQRDGFGRVRSRARRRLGWCHNGERDRPAVLAATRSYRRRCAAAPAARSLSALISRACGSRRRGFAGHNEAASSERHAVDAPTRSCSEWSARRSSRPHRSVVHVR